MNMPMPEIKDPAEILIEFIEFLNKIDVTPDKIKRNSIAMTDSDGICIKF